MAHIPQDLKYTQTHEWVKKEGEFFVLGITDYAQDALGDVVYVELPNVGRRISQEEAFAVVESVKAASDIYAPIAGEIVAINEDLNTAPEQINHHPYDAWLVKIKADYEDDFWNLLSANDYSASLIID